MDPFLDEQDVDGKKADPWNSSSSLLTEHLSSVTVKPSWMDSPAMLPPPPPAKLSAVPPPLASVTVDPWQSSADSSQRTYSVIGCLCLAVEKLNSH